MYGFVSLDDPVLPTFAVMGDDPMNATRGFDAWGEAMNYAHVNGLIGVEVPLGVLPVDGTPMMDGSQCLSIRGWGRLRSQIKKYGSAASTVDETDSGRVKNTRVGINVAYPNAALHVFNQWSDGEVRDVGFVSDTGLGPTASTDFGVVIHGASHAQLRNVFIQGFKQIGLVDLYPTICSEFDNVRIDRVGNGAVFWSHNQCKHDIVYSSRFRHWGISASLDGGYMEACPVELGGETSTGHLQSDVPIAYGFYGCRQAEVRNCIAEGNLGSVLEMSGNDGLEIRNMLALEHSSDYVGPYAGIYSTYAANCNKTTIDLKVEYKTPALAGGAAISKHYDFGGTGNTGATTIRNEYATSWGGKSNGAL